MTHEVAETFFEQIKAQASAGELLSKEHFTADGTLPDAASIKSFMRKDAESGEGSKSDEQQPGDQGRNKEVNFHGEELGNATHQFVTDGEARLYRKAKGKEAKLSFMGQLLTENRNGLIVQASVSQASGTAEREVALAMLDADQSSGRRALGADKNYDTRALCGGLPRTPSIAACGTEKTYSD